jgi:hypothetical protein
MPGSRWELAGIWTISPGTHQAAQALDRPPIRRLGIGKAGFMQKQKPLMYKAILARIKEIDLKFRSTEPWLHPTLSKLARERELLVEQANRDFKVGLKHDWR